MASNLRVDTILPSTGTTLGIGTAGGTINFLGNSNIVTSGTLNAASASITGNLGVGGTLTYEDVTNIDSIGIVTARLGINLVGNDLNVGSNIKIGNASGIITATSFRGDASQMTGAGLGTDGSANTSGIITATAFVSDTALSHRNMVINGAAMVSQRLGTSTYNLTGASPYFPVDRFRCWSVGGGTLTIQQSADAPSGFQNSIMFTVNTADTDALSQNGTYYIMQQRIEGYNTRRLNMGQSNAQSSTLSFWVKSDVTGTYCAMLNNKDQNRCYMKEFTVSSANTWEYKTLTYPGDTTGTWVHGNTDGVQLNWCLASGANYQGTANQWNTSWKDHTSNQVNFMATSGNKIRFTGVQLEVGPVATPFEHRSFGEELLRCMRYYEGVYMTDGTALMKAYAAYGGGANFEYQFKVEKRTTPTFSLEGNASWSGATPNAYESRSACLFQHNGGTLFSLGDAHDDLCASFTAEL